MWFLLLWYYDPPGAAVLRRAGPASARQIPPSASPYRRGGCTLNRTLRERVAASIHPGGPAYDDRRSTKRIANGRPASAPPSPFVKASGVQRSIAASTASQ